MRKLAAFTIAAALVPAVPLFARGGLLHLQWQELSMVVGHPVRIGMAEGILTGKATAVDGDGLELRIQKTTVPGAWPKGPARIPREKVLSLEMQTKGKGFRILCTSVLGGLGLITGETVSYFGVNGCGIFSGCSHRRPGAAAATTVGITAAAAIGGYLAGNAADKRWTAIVIEKQPK